MSIEDLENGYDMYIKRDKEYDVKIFTSAELFIRDYTKVLINILKDQADEIANLKQQLAQNPDYVYVPRMEGTNNVDNLG